MADFFLDGAITVERLPAAPAYFMFEGVAILRFLDMGVGGFIPEPWGVGGYSNCFFDGATGLCPAAPLLLSALSN